MKVADISEELVEGTYPERRTRHRTPNSIVFVLLAQAQIHGHGHNDPSDDGNAAVVLGLWPLRDLKYVVESMKPHVNRIDNYTNLWRYAIRTMRHSLLATLPRLALPLEGRK